MLRMLPLLVALALAASACDTDPVADCPGDPDCPPVVFDPSTVDYDTVTSLDFESQVRPLLAARNPFGFTEGGARVYNYADFLDADAASAIIPFDAAASPLIRLATQELADGIANPYPEIEGFEPDEVRFLERWIEDGARGPDGRPAYADATRLLYVCNQLAGRVAVVDVDRQRTIRHVHFADLGQPANAKPHHVVADGRTWYVTLIDGTGGGSVLKMDGSLLLDPADPAIVLAEEMPTGGEDTFQKPGMLALDAERDRLYAGRSFSADASSSNLAALRTDDLTFDTFETGPIHPHAVGVSADGQFVYTAALTSIGGETEVFVLEAAGGDRVQRLALPGQLAFVHFAVSQRDPLVALSSQTGDALYVFDVQDDPDAPDYGTLALRHTVPVEGQPWHPALSPLGPVAYVPNRTGGTVSVVDMSTGAVVQTIRNAAFSQPHGAAVSADGELLFISSRNLAMTGQASYDPPLRFVVDGEEEPADLYGNVVILDASSGAEVAVIPQGRFASGLAYVEL